MIIRSLRTFGETALSYFIINVANLLAAGGTLTDNITLDLLAGICISALSAGFAAILNLPKGDKNENK